MTVEREILTVRDVAMELRCSSAHVYNVINGMIKGTSRLPAITIGRRKLVQRLSLERWKKLNESGYDEGASSWSEVDAVGRIKED
jgi:hypothetical protein